MTRQEWSRLIRVADQLAFTASAIGEIPENVCSHCYALLVSVQADLIDIIGQLAAVDVSKMIFISQASTELQ